MGRVWKGRARILERVFLILLWLQVLVMILVSNKMFLKSKKIHKTTQTYFSFATF